MGVAERRSREKQQRIDSIVDAAEQVIFAEGIDIATMDQIADLAEVSKGTLYLYFKHKQDLYLAIYTRALDRLERRFAAARGESLSGLEEVQRIGRYFQEFAREEPDYYQALAFFESRPAGESLSTYREMCNRLSGEVLRHLIAAIEKGQRDGSVRTDMDAGQVGALLWAQSAGVIQLMTMHQDSGLMDQLGVNAARLYDLLQELIQQALQRR